MSFDFSDHLTFPLIYRFLLSDFRIGVCLF
jgi:hypothetical protein